MSKPGRDERGLFTKGNSIAKGNRGNRYPKYGNQNSLKHGLYCRAVYALRYDESSGRLFLKASGATIAEIPAEHFCIDAGQVYCSPAAVEVLKRYGIKFE